MATGGYVDDETMLAIIRDRVAQPDAAHGFILDGFPRTVAQAEGLTKLMTELGTPLDAVVLFEVDTEQLVQAHFRAPHLRVLQEGVQHPHRAAVGSGRSACRAAPSTSCCSARTTRKTPCSERLREYEEDTRKPVSCLLLVHGPDAHGGCRRRDRGDHAAPARHAQAGGGRASSRAEEEACAAAPRQAGRAKSRARKRATSQRRRKVAKKRRRSAAPAASKKRAQAARKAARTRAPGAPARASQSADSSFSPSTSARQPRSRLTSRLPAASFSSSRRVASTSALISSSLATSAAMSASRFTEREPARDPAARAAAAAAADRRCRPRAPAPAVLRRTCAPRIPASPASAASASGERGRRSTISRRLSVVEDPAARAIAFDRRAARARRRAPARAADAAGSSAGRPLIFFQASSGATRSASALASAASSSSSQARRPFAASVSNKLARSAREVAHVVERVFLLLGGQRAARPVGARVRLGELDAEQPARQLRVADLRGMSGERRGDLRVEHRLHQARPRAAALRGPGARRASP